MATAGITYKYVLKDEYGNVVNQNGQPFVNTTQSEYTVPIAAPGDYTVEVTSPLLPDSCKFDIETKKSKRKSPLLPKQHLRLGKVVTSVLYVSKHQEVKHLISLLFGV